MSLRVTPLKRLFRRNLPVQAPPFKHAHYLNQLKSQDLKSLLLPVEKNLLFRGLPRLEGNKVLFLSQPAVHSFVNELIPWNADLLLRYEYEPTATLRDSPCPAVRGDLNNLAIRKNTFDLVLAPLGQLLTEDHKSVIHRLSSTVQAGGQVIVSLIHPFLEYLITNQNPYMERKSSHSLEATLNLFKEAGLSLTEVKEGIIDDNVRFFFQQRNEESQFEELSGLPLILLLKGLRTHESPLTVVS